MVNSAAISCDSNRNQGFTEKNILSSNSQSSSPITASGASSKNDFPSNPDAHAIEPMSTQPDSDSMKTSSENYGAKTNSNDKASFCCSVPLDKVQIVLSTIKSEDEVKPKPKSARKVLCLYCDRSFVNANLRQKHVERCHSSKQQRRVSLRKNQNNITNTPCVYCDKLTETEHTLRELFEHLCISHANKYFGCLSCEDRFLNSNHLADHNETAHKRDISTIERREVFVKITKEVPEDVPVKITRSRVKIKNESCDSTIVDVPKGRKKQENKGANNIKEQRNKKPTVKTSKIMLKRSKRLQSKVIEPTTKKKRPKNMEKKERQLKQEQLVSNSTKLNEKTAKVPTSVNPYPEFDSFFRVKKITDHSIDNLKISSLTFDDVFDKAFFNRIRCNIQENLLHHIDGKLFKNEESESRISNFEKISNVPPEVQNLNSENYGCELSLNAVTPATSLLSSTQFGEDLESQIEYGSKPSKKKTQIKKDEVHYKYFTRRKYQASILEHKENRDLSKLDMWTQYVIKNRQQKIIDDKKTAQEILDYFSGEEYKNKMRREELNRILDRRGPFEDLKKEVCQKAALDAGKVLDEDNLSEIRDLLTDLVTRVVNEVTEVKPAVNQENTDIIKIDPTDEDVPEIPHYLNLRRTSSLPSEGEIDKSDRIALICSSQETENFELPTNSIRGKDEKVELTGEWARSRLYICAACGLKLQNIKQFIEHKSLYHQNVWVQHYEFVGNQGELYRHLCIPVLGKVGVLEETVQPKVWCRSDARLCTKCQKQCNSLGELHRHILECGGDWTWMLARKKCKYRPFGAKSRRKRRGLVKRIYTQKTEPTEKKVYKKAIDGPRPKPSDAETIQRMLANLPAKRATRKIMCLKDGFNNTRNTQQIKKSPKTQTKLKCGKAIHRKLNESNNTENADIKAHNKTQSFRRSLRTLNKVFASRILDTNSKLIVKRKYKKKFSKQLNKEQGSVPEVATEDAIVDSSEQKLDNAVTCTKNEESHKRTSPRIERQGTLKKITESMNIKKYFSVRKRKNATQLPNSNLDKMPKDSLEEVVKNKKIAANTAVPESSQNICTETVGKQEGNEEDGSKSLENTRKRKLRNTFKKVVEQVKKLKMKSPVDATSIESKKDCTESVDTGNFLVESPMLKTDTGPPELEKIVIPAPPSEKNKNVADPAIPVPIVVNSHVSALSGTVFDLQIDNEKTLQAKGHLQLDNQNNSLCTSNTLLSPKTKSKIRKPSRGLNDCIAMLTSKLTKNVEDTSSKPLTPVNPSVAAESYIYKSSPETDKQDCILKVPLFNEHFQLKPKTDPMKATQLSHHEFINQITQELPVNMTCKKLNEILKPSPTSHVVQTELLVENKDHITSGGETVHLDLLKENRHTLNELERTTVDGKVIKQHTLNETSQIQEGQETLKEMINICQEEMIDLVQRETSLNDSNNKQSTVINDKIGESEKCDEIKSITKYDNTMIQVFCTKNHEDPVLEKPLLDFDISEREDEAINNILAEAGLISSVKKTISKTVKAVKTKKKLGQKRTLTRKSKKHTNVPVAVEEEKCETVDVIKFDNVTKECVEPPIDSEDEMPLALFMKNDDLNADQVSQDNESEGGKKATKKYVNNGAEDNLKKEVISTEKRLNHKRICVKLKPRFLRKRKNYKKKVLEEIDNVIANNQVYKSLVDTNEKAVTPCDLVPKEKGDITLNQNETDFESIEDTKPQERSSLSSQSKINEDNPAKSINEPDHLSSLEKSSEIYFEKHEDSNLDKETNANVSLCKTADSRSESVVQNQIEEIQNTSVSIEPEDVLTDKSTKEYLIKDVDKKTRAIALDSLSSNSVSSLKENEKNKENFEEDSRSGDTTIGPSARKKAAKTPNTKIIEEIACLAYAETPEIKSSQEEAIPKEIQKNVPFKNNSENDNDGRELRRSRRSSKKITSYNEIDLVDPLLDDLENDKNIRQIVEEVWSNDAVIESEFIFKSKKKNALEPRKKNLKNDGKEAKLNSDELFDLLKTTSSENVVLSKPTNSFFNNFDELSDDFNDDNYDTLENILEKSMAVIEEDLAEGTESLAKLSTEPTEQTHPKDKVENEVMKAEDNKEKCKKSKKKRTKHRKIQEKILGKEIEGKLDALDSNVDSKNLNYTMESLINVENTDSSSLSIQDNKISKTSEVKASYCEICNKSFARSESLTKHKRTLTHISKLSEIEAKEAEMKNKQNQQVNDNTHLSEVIEITSDSSKNDLNLLDMLNTIETTDSKRLESPFSVTVDNTSLKLADIINDVLNKPVLDREIDKHNFSDIIMQNSNEIQTEYRRYRSLGERKSFEADNSSTSPKDNVAAKSVDYFEPQISKAAGTILEKQITLLQNIIENRSGLSYIDDISVSSAQSANDNISNEMILSTTNQDSNMIYDKPAGAKSRMNEESFLKPAQYEEISEDSSLRNYEEQKSRKVLNRDEELFLECCSLLKSGSEVSNYSKNSNKVTSNIGLKTCEEPDWLENKSLSRKEPFGIVESYSDTSRMMTPLGDTFENDDSGSNTISSNWNMTKSNPEKPKDITGGDIFIFKEEEENNSEFDGISQEIKKQFNLLCDKVKKRFRSTSEVSSTSSGSYNDPKATEELSDTSTTDSKKMLTKGAMKVFEGLKVSIPTEDLNMSKLLICSPTSKKSALTNDLLEGESTSRKRSISKTKIPKIPKVKVNAKEKRSSKFAKYKKLDEADSSKIHDIYDFEETQDNSDVFTKPDFKTFRNKIEEIKKVDKADSDNDSQDCADSSGFEAFSSSTSSISDLPTKKQKTNQNITKKKCMIMGRIFKNAAKSRIEEDIRSIPLIDNAKLVEDFVLNCPEPTIVEDSAVKQKKMTEAELDLAFDQLLNSSPNSSHKQASNVVSNKQETKNAQYNKKKLKTKTKKKCNGNSETSDDEFSLNPVKKRTNKKINNKSENSCINLEQELKECIGVASRKSQRKCTSGKQNVLVEYWSSDESSFEALLESQIIPIKPPVQSADQTPLKQEVETKLCEIEEVENEKCNAQFSTSHHTEKSPLLEKKLPKKSKHGDIKKSDSNSNRRKRAAANPLYHWSSSSEDESYDLIEVKPIRDEIDDDDDDDRPIQHGWIVGDSPKKLVTMLAQAKGKKCDVDGVKEQGKKRTNAFS